MFKKILLICEGVILGLLSVFGILCFLYEKYAEAYVIIGAVVVLLSITFLLMQPVEIKNEVKEEKEEDSDKEEETKDEVKEVLPLNKIPSKIIFMDASDEDGKKRDVEHYGDEIRLFEDHIELFAYGEKFDSITFVNIERASIQDEKVFLTVRGNYLGYSSRMYGFGIESKLKEKIFKEYLKKYVPAYKISDKSTNE